jgi:hypothetical protein
MTQPEGAVLDPSTIVWVRLVTDTLTPSNQAFLNGVLLGFPGPWTPPDAGTQIITGVYGYARTPLIPSTPIETTYEWVVQPQTDPVVTFIAGLPGADGWHDTNAQDQYVTIARALLASGVQPETAVGYIQKGYYGAISNYVAAHPAS